MAAELRCRDDLLWNQSAEVETRQCDAMSLEAPNSNDAEGLKHQRARITAIQHYSACCFTTLST